MRTRTERPNYDALPLFADPRYDLYSAIRSHTPERQRFYDWLEAHGWRWDGRRAEWHAPESGPANNWSVRGRVCTAHDNSRAWVQPPGPAPTVEDVLNRVPTVPAPLLSLAVDAAGVVAVTP